MGVSYSCPNFDDLDSRFEAVLVKSINYEGGDGRNLSRSLSFNGRDSNPTPTLETYSSEKVIFHGSLSFKGSMVSNKTPGTGVKNDVSGKASTPKVQDFGDEMPRSEDSSSDENIEPPLKEPNHRYQAALRLQKVYKSFRTRRQLADCAVLVEQRCFPCLSPEQCCKICDFKACHCRWKLLDFAELKRSSISFFEIEKPETAVSRWSRARTRAAKVGKGLSKDAKARKLALQHWLEAIDPRHRYGHNLQFYYAKWLHCQSKQPFFYWLDIGEGREFNLDRCPRSKLLQQCIKYLGPIERKAYEIAVRDGRFMYKQSGKLVDTRGEPKGSKWIFVLSTSKTLYIGQKNKGTFQHSSFLAGGATLSAGRLNVEDGILKAVWPHSGHYLPTEENFQEFMSFLEEHKVDLNNVKKNPSEEEEEDVMKSNVACMRSIQSEPDLSTVSRTKNVESFDQENTSSRCQDSNATENPSIPKMSRLQKRLSSQIAKLEIPQKSNVFDIFKKDSLPRSCRNLQPDSPSEDGYETAEESFLTEEDFMCTKRNLFDDEDQEEDNEKPIPKEKIMQRIDSHKGMKSYQLAQQLTSRWTTGAGPRIGCMRDYPSELQFRVLEQANLSPRSKGVNSSSRNLSRFSPRVVPSPPSSCRETSSAASTPCRSPIFQNQVLLSQTAPPQI
nr:IQ domain-containing protein IQM6 isoform X1 [Ziziphus jujuba var. spinosa]